MISPEKTSFWEFPLKKMMKKALYIHTTYNNNLNK